MKKLKFVLLLNIFALMALFNIINAQMISFDKNWNTTPVFIDNFTPPTPPSVRVWDAGWVDYPLYYKWMANYLWCTTHGAGEHQVFQKENAIFNISDSTIILRASYEGWLDSTYSLPPFEYDYSGWHDKLYYYSGAITAIEPFKYGYFETRCKYPVSSGSFPAFWLWNYSNGNYREIDIFEYSWLFRQWYEYIDSTRFFTGGIWYSNNSPTNGRYGDHVHNLQPNEPDLSNWHTYGVEWSPKRVVWYFDSIIVGEYLGDSVPSENMYLLLNLSLDNYVLDDNGDPITNDFPRDMVIDYVRVNKLSCNCDIDAIIQNNIQLAAYNYSVKNTITVGGYGYPVSVPSGNKVVLRADEGITINGDFEVPLGSELELIVHPCPE